VIGIFVKPEMHGETCLLHGPYRNGSTEGITVILCGGNALDGTSESSKLQFSI
jgi:hypothetical protein